MEKENDKIKFTLRMNEKQKRKLARLAERAGVSQARYLLGLLDGVSFQPRPPREFWELMKELRCFSMTSLTTEATLSPTAAGK